MKSPLLGLAVAFLLLTLTAAAPRSFADGYTQTNLVSDVSGLAQFTDSNLVNPWGMAFSATSPFWISDQHNNVSTLYASAPATLATPNAAIVVTVPGGPTGAVNNSAGTGTFEVNGAASSFLFDTLSGTIAGWNNSLGTMGTAGTVVTTAGAVYTGLAQATSGGSSYLYAANFTSTGAINVFNSSFTQVNSTTFAGKFVDPSLPSGYLPYNIQNVGGDLYVTYAELGASAGNAMRGAGLGYVAEYDSSGDFLGQFTNSALNAPWGVTLAPSNFGQYSNDLLVGNFGNGEINAFNPSTDALVGTLDSSGGSAIVNNDLWALNFNSQDPGTLFLTAGIDGEQEGLFAEITPTPEPGITLLLSSGLLALWAIKRGQRQRFAKQ